MPPAKIVEVTFASVDRVRDVIRNFNTDGFDSLYPKYSGGRLRKFTLPGISTRSPPARSHPSLASQPW